MSIQHLQDLCEIYRLINIYNQYRLQASTYVGELTVTVPAVPGLSPSHQHTVAEYLRLHLIDEQGTIVGCKLEELHAERVRLETAVIDGYFLKESIMQSGRFNDWIEEREKVRAATAAQFDTKWLPEQRIPVNVPIPASTWRRGQEPAGIKFGADAFSELVGIAEETEIKEG